jgi:hypothetical protein
MMSHVRHAGVSVVQRQLKRFSEKILPEFVG